MMTLADIGEALTGRRPRQAISGSGVHCEALPFGDVVVDSRLASPGSLFVALPGEQRDGHEYVRDALARGARGALVKPLMRQNPPPAILWQPGDDLPDGPPLDKPICIVVEDTLQALQRIAAYWRRRFPACQVIGVTGSLGKTTTKELVAAVLGQRFRALKSPGNYNNEIGLPLTLLRLDESYERAVLEMSMYALGEIALLAEIAQPRVGVVTNVQPIHLERLGSLARIAQAKAELLAALPADGAAVLNGDDPHVRAMGVATPARRVLYYGLRPDNDLWADQVSSRGLAGIALRWHWQGRQIPVELPLLGGHSVWTALAAAGVGLVEEMSWEEIIGGLRQPGSALRLTLLPGLRQTTILDDTYNAAPASTVAALDFLASLGGRAVAVLGDMLELGVAEEEGHRQVGRKAAEVVQRLLAVGPRARLIAEVAQASGLPAAAIHLAAGNQAAVACLREWLQPEDFVLIKGSRGMKMEEIVAAIKEEGA